MRGQGAELPCGVWGNAPTVPRATNSKRKVHKGAGSEASLPVTLRSRRSAPPSCSFQHLCCVAPDGRDRIACLPNIACLSRKQEIFAMQYCTLEKEGFLGTFYERETPSEKAVILVGGSGEGRAVKVLQPCARKIGMSGLSLGAACTLLCANGKIARSDAASAGENDDDGSKIPGGVQPCQCGQLDETG